MVRHPFLVAANVVINYRNVVKQSFRNMTLELNVFNDCKQPIIDCDELQNINLIEKIYKEEDTMLLGISDLLELPLVTDGEFLKKFKFNDAIWFVNYMIDAHYLYVIGWILQKEAFEELSSQTKKINSLHYRNLNTWR